MKASELPLVPGATHFFVRGSHTWGRGATLEEALKNACAVRGNVVHVCRCDSKATCDSIDGSLLFERRGEIWLGKVYSSKDVTLKTVTHPMRNPEGTK